MTSTRARPRKAGVAPPRREWRWLVLVGAGLLLVGAFLIYGMSRPGTGSPRALTTLTTQDAHALAFSTDSADQAYFGHHGGILETRDGGQNWRPLEAGPLGDAMNLALPRAAGGPRYLAGHDIFLKSIDGVRWQPVANNLPGLDLHAFVASPADPRRLYAFAVGYGLFASSDGGTTWEPRDTSLPQSTVSLAIASTTPETLYAATMGVSLFVSIDGGKSFAPGAPLGGLASTVAVSPRDTSVLYVGTSKGLYRSDDAGRSFAPTGLADVGVAALAISPSNPDTLLVVDRQKRVYRSVDGGRSW